MYAPKTKHEFYERYMRGEFGNRPRTWATWDELKADSYRGRVAIRGLIPGIPCYYGVEVNDLLAGKLPVGCGTLVDKRFNESMPDEFLTIQGNVWLSELGLRLEYSCEPNVGHRNAVNPPLMRTAERTRALSLLKTHMDDNSYSDLEELFELYPDGIIEFSTYSKHVGVLPGRSTVFWEVRSY